MNMQSQEKFRKLLSPIQLGELKLKNRFVFLAHWTNYGNNHGYQEDGLASERLASHYIERAKGGAALVCVTQSCGPGGQMGRTMVNAADSRNEKIFREMSSKIHSFGCKVFGQFNHAGHTSCMQRPPLLYAPSQMTGPHSYVNTKEIEIEEMEEIKKSFVVSAVQQKEWGFDGVEIKIAHDGLLRTFVSPYLNRRSDRYDGSFENRMQYPIEIIQTIRKEVGEGYPIGIRLCMDEFTDWGYSVDYSLKIAKALEKAGVTYINTDSGSFSNYNMEIPNSYIPMSFAVYMSAALKRTINIPVVAFGRINDPVQAEIILEEGNADLIGMCRQLICDPETPNKTIEDRVDEIRHCIACSEGCGMVTTQEGVVCIHNPAAGREKRLGISTLHRAEKKKHIMIIGAGVAGLKTAEIAARRGHKVTVFEKTDKVGGQLLLAEKIPYRSEIEEIYRYLKMQLNILNVPIVYNCAVDENTVEENSPDCVVVATGSDATLPSYAETIPEIKVLESRTAMNDIGQIGEHVLLFDDIGYWQGLGVADYIASIGTKITVVTREYYAGIDIEGTCRELLYKRLYQAGANIITSHKLKEFRKGDVVLENVFNHEEQIIKGIDTIVAAQESRSNSRLYYSLKMHNKYEVYSVGDAKAPRTILQIVFDAEEIGRII